MIDRRKCLQSLAAVTAMVATGGAKENAERSASDRIWIFTKPLQHLSYQEVADWLVRWDVGGLEATVRKDGWIESDQAAVELPKLMDALSAVKRTGMILCSDVNSADQAEVEQVLSVASKLGIRYFRMSYYKYDFNKKILPQLDAFAAQATKLANVCKQLKMTALYQNHAGANYVGAPLWDLMEVMRGIDPTLMSIALDIRHATVEASESWRAGYARIRESVGAIYAKDAIYVDGDLDNGPLGRSKKCKQLFDIVEADYPMHPICLHMEYIDHRKKELLQERLDAITKDVATLKGWL